MVSLGIVRAAYHKLIVARRPCKNKIEVGMSRSMSIELLKQLQLHREWSETLGKAGKLLSLEGANLAELDLREQNLMQAHLPEVRLDYAQLQKADLYSANLASGSFFSANLSQANLNKANLDYANL